MSLVIKVPPVGESISEVTLSQWIKKDGDYVEMDEVIAELESDEAIFELTVEKAGTLKTIANEGDTLQIGAPVCSIEEGGKQAETKESAPKAELNNKNKSKYQFQSRSEEEVYNFDNKEDFIEYCQIYFEEDIYKEHLNAYMYSTDYGSAWKFISQFHDDDEIKNIEKNKSLWVIIIIIVPILIGLNFYLFGNNIWNALFTNNQITEQVQDEFVLDTSAFAENVNTTGANRQLDSGNYSNNTYSYLTDNQLNEAFKNYMSDSYFGFTSYSVKGKTIRVKPNIVMNTSIRALQRENQSIFDELLKRYDKIVFWDEFGESITITRMEE